MGKMSKKIQKKINLGPEYNNKYLTESEYQRLQNEVCEKVAGKMMEDALLVCMEILDRHFMKCLRRKNRFVKFGVLFKALFKVQGRTHSKDYMERLIEANLLNLDYGAPDK